MGCSNSTHADEVERLPVKTVDPSQLTTPSSSSVTASTSRPTTPQQVQQPDVPTTTDTAPAGACVDVNGTAEQVQVSEPEPDPEEQQATMEPSVTLSTHTAMDPESGEVALVGPNDEQFAETTAAPEKEQCSVCFEEKLKDTLIYPCNKCTTANCETCLRKLFLTACTDESRMPPRCCIPLNVGAAAAVLTVEEAAHFKDKHEEWATANRVYCPIPTCSVFIPYRLFPPETQSLLSRESKEEQSRKPQADLVTDVSAPLPCALTSSMASPSQSRSIPCPKCAVDICCSCKQLAHSGSPCPEGADDLDPELVELLKKWNIKRCPKCRAAVRRMYGCSHMACRCGGQWCWYCNRQIDRCRSEGCPNEPDYDTESYVEDEGEEGGERPDNPDRDLDAGRHWDAGQYFFGMEPNIALRDPWACNHDWRKAVESDVRENVRYTCERCWTPIRPQASCYPEVKTLLERGFIPERQLDETEQGNDSTASMIFCTLCSLMVCDSCQSTHTGFRRE